MKTFILQITNYNHPRKVALTISGYFTQQVRISLRNLLVGFLVWIFSARKIPGGSFFKFLAEGTYSRESGESGESTDSASSFPLPGGFKLVAFGSQYCDVITATGKV